MTKIYYNYIKLKIIKKFSKKKIENFEKTYGELTEGTVKTFLIDYKKSNFKILDI
tara:strand:+ start:754 stop:918 length:165 start_codon:yes stop_codon:yes gene_type:complete